MTRQEVNISHSSNAKGKNVWSFTSAHISIFSVIDRYSGNSSVMFYLYTICTLNHKMKDLVRNIKVQVRGLILKHMH
jgi:hypothetical protein